MSNEAAGKTRLFNMSNALFGENPGRFKLLNERRGKKSSRLSSRKTVNGRRGAIDVMRLIFKRFARRRFCAIVLSG